MDVKLLVEIVGWIGAALILAAYALITSGRLNAQSVSFQLMNVLGAAGFVVNSGYNGAVPSAVLNVVWMGIGIVALVRLSQSKKNPQAGSAAPAQSSDENVQPEIPKIGSSDAPGG